MKQTDQPGARSEAADQATREAGFPGRPVAALGVPAFAGRRRQPAGGPTLLLLALLSGALAAPAAAQPNGPGATGKPVPAPGQGAGYHSPQSQFPPLKEREGVVSWSVLSSVTTRVEGAFVRPVYPKAVQALNNREVTVQGFMMPLEPGKQQKHFLLSAVPTTCSFCTPAGPEGLIEVKSKGPVTFSQEAVTVRGKMSVLPSDPYGMFYRLADGQLVK